MRKKIKKLLSKIHRLIKRFLKKPDPSSIDTSEYILTEKGEQLSTEDGNNLIL